MHFIETNSSIAIRTTLDAIATRNYYKIGKCDTNTLAEKCARNEIFEQIFIHKLQVLMMTVGREKEDMKKHTCKLVS